MGCYKENEWIISTISPGKSEKVFDMDRFHQYNDIIDRSLKRRNWLMKSTGIIRKVDELGRIVLPIELRRTLDISERDELEIYMENDRIILQKFEPACVFCGSFRNLISFRRKNVCSECVRKMGEY
jgi:transcriptional pleiotropic regulator of transition state genes